MTWRALIPPVSAERTTKPKLPSTRANSRVAAKIGLRYERKVIAALRKRYLRVEVEHCPWFRWEDKAGSGLACPDALIHVADHTIIVEVKYTFTPEALIKLREFYGVIVVSALRRPILPLVIARNLTPQAADARQTLADALVAPNFTLHWLGNGPIL